MDWFYIVLQLGLPLLLLVLGYAMGRTREWRHIRSLVQREQAPGPALTNLRRIPAGRRVRRSQLCIGATVVANDYFKAFGAVLKNLVGGRLRTLETLLDRGRREALQRVRRQAAELGADFVLNIRLDTSIIMGGRRNQAAGAVEVTAYGTAVVTEPDPGPDSGTAG